MATKAPRPFGPFMLLRSMGKSSLGESFLATTPWDDAPIAVIKILSVAAGEVPGKDLRRIEHPNVVTTLEIGSVFGRSYVASELVLGKSVSRIIPRIRGLRRPTPAAIAVRLWSDLLTGLAWLHERHPHGEVTQSNVVVTYGGIGKLADASLPLARESASVSADLFGAASSILRLLGKELPPPLDALLSAMLAKDITKRPQSAREALEKLLDAAAGENEPATRVEVLEWMAELFAGEKAEELDELAVLRGRSKDEEELPWFGESGDEASTSSWSTFGEVSTGEQPELDTEIFTTQLDFGQGSDETTPQLVEAGATERSAAPVVPRNAKVRTVVLDDDANITISPPPKNQERFGPYRILGKIGDGGMAEVLLAEGADGRRCVLKRVAPTLRVDRDFAEMFQAEARIVQKLRHPNIVQCLDAGSVESIGFITFELIDGLDLAKLITELAPAKIPLSTALELGEAVARALDYAHRLTGDDGRPLDVVHRDVSPENVLISWGAEVKLLDFGISRFRDRTFATRAGVLKGKLGYMAPEQLSSGAADARTDLYQLGVVLAETLSGQRLFPGDSMSRPRDLAEMRAVIERLVSGVPPRAIDLIARLCAPDRNARPASAQQVMSEIAELRAKVTGPTLAELVGPRAPPGWTAPRETTEIRSQGSGIPLLVVSLMLVTVAVAAIVYWLLTS